MATETQQIWKPLYSGSGIIAIVIISTYVVTKINSSIPLLICIFYAASHVHHRNIADIRKRIRHHAQITPPALSKPESADWVNGFLATFWPRFEPQLSADLHTSINKVLKNVSNVGLDLALSSFTLGSTPPGIVGIGSATASHFTMDINLKFIPVDIPTESVKSVNVLHWNSNIQLVARLTGLPLRVVLKDVEIEGIIRVIIKFINEPPHISTVSITFLETPQIAFQLRPLGAGDLTNISLLKNLIHGLVQSNLGFMTHPNYLKIPVGAPKNRELVGVLHVCIYEAFKIKPKSVDLAAPKDLSCSIIINQKTIAETLRITSSTQWNECFEIVVYKDFLESPIEESETKLGGGLFHIEIYMGLKLYRQTCKLDLGEYVGLLSKKDTETEDSTKPTESEIEHVLESSNGATASENVNMGTSNSLSEWGVPVSYPTDLILKLFDDQTNPTKSKLRIDMTFSPILPLTAEFINCKAGVVRIQFNKLDNFVGSYAKKAGRSIMCEVTATTNPKTLHLTPKKKLEKSVVFESQFDFFCKDVDDTFLVIRVLEPSDFSALGNIGNATLNVATFGTVSASTSPVCLGETKVLIGDLIGKSTKFMHEDDMICVPISDTASSAIAYLGVEFTPIDLSHSFLPVPAQHKDPIGLLRVNIVEASGLLNVEVLGKSDAYTKLNLGSKNIGSTRAIENCLDPVWRTVVYGVVYENANLSLECFDWNEVQKHKWLGGFKCSLLDLLSTRKDGDLEGFGDAEKKSREWDELVEDGLKVSLKKDNPTIIDVWAPLYVSKPDGLDSFEYSVGSRPKKSITENIFGKNGIVAGMKNKTSWRTKGKIHFELEFFGVVGEIIQASLPIPKKVLEDRNMVVAPTVQIPDSKPPMNITKFMAENPLGILRFRIETGYLPRPMRSYIEMWIENELIHQTHTAHESQSPAWNNQKDIFIDVTNSLIIKINIKHQINEKQAPQDPVVCAWTGSLATLVGIAYNKLVMSNSGSLRVSVGFCATSISKSVLKNTQRGNLHIELLESVNLNAVDSNGTSDPYCIVYMNGLQIHRTKVHYKSLNVEWGENLSTDVDARDLSVLKFVVLDSNAVTKDVQLGFVEYKLSSLNCDKMTLVESNLKGGTGKLSMRLYFDTSDVTVNGIDVSFERKGGVIGFAKGLTNQVTQQLNFMEKVKSNGGLARVSHGNPRSLIAVQEIQVSSPGMNTAMSANLDGISSKQSLKANSSEKSVESNELSQLQPVLKRSAMNSTESLLNLAQIQKSGSRHLTRSSDSVSGIAVIRTSQSSRRKETGKAYVVSTGRIYIVTIVGATGLSVSDKRTVDSYVKMYVGTDSQSGSVFKTKVVKKSCGPVWNDVMQISLGANSELFFQVMHHSLLKDIKIGSAKIGLATVLDVGNIWLNLDDDGAKLNISILLME